MQEQKLRRMMLNHNVRHAIKMGMEKAEQKGWIKEQDIATAIYVQLDRVVRISNHINVERSRSEEIVRDGYITSTSQIYGE